MDIIRKTMAAVKLCSVKPNSTGEEDKENYVYAITERKKNEKHKGSVSNPGHANRCVLCLL